MSKDDREVVADWLMLAGAVALFVSLFLPWSHQLPPGFEAIFGSSDLLQGVPRDPTAWQVYSAADVVLALLAALLLGVALLGSRPVRIAATGATLLGLAFALHALSDPPSNGAANIFSPGRSVPSYLPVTPGAGIGETVAILALAGALVGLVLSFTAD